MAMKKISVIIPVYNMEKYLAKCLDSVLYQEYDDYEILIIDDGSTDNSRDIIDYYMEKYSDRIEVVCQKNKGLGGARNTGIENAKGEYFLFLDSDDSLENNVLCELDKEINRTNAQIIVYGIKTISENGGELQRIEHEQKKHEKLDLKSNRDIFLILPAAWNKLYHRDLFIKTGIRFPEKVWYEDIRTIIKLYPIAKGISFIDKCYYNYLQRSGSIMNNSNVKRNIEILYAFDDIIEYYNKNQLMESYQDEIEFLAIQHIFIAAIVRVLRQDSKSDLIKVFDNYMKEKFPNYKSNKYISTLPNNKKIIYYLLKYQMYWCVRVIFKIKKYMA